MNLHTRYYNSWLVNGAVGRDTGHHSDVFELTARPYESLDEAAIGCTDAKTQATTRLTSKVATRLVNVEDAARISDIPPVDHGLEARRMLRAHDGGDRRNATVLNHLNRFDLQVRVAGDEGTRPSDRRSGVLELDLRATRLRQLLDQMLGGFAETLLRQRRVALDKFQGEIMQQVLLCVVEGRLATDGRSSNNHFSSALWLRGVAGTPLHLCAEQLANRDVVGLCNSAIRRVRMLVLVVAEYGALHG